VLDRRPRADDAQRTRNLLLGALRGLQGPLKAKQRWVGLLQKLPAFVGQ